VYGDSYLSWTNTPKLTISVSGNESVLVIVFSWKQVRIC
jgi:hypothetical protein